jgi:hypothetical protein
VVDVVVGAATVVGGLEVVVEPFAADVDELEVGSIVESAVLELAQPATRTTDASSHNGTADTARFRTVINTGRPTREKTTRRRQ